MAAQNLAEIISSLTAEEQESVLQFVELLKQKESRLSSCVPSRLWGRGRRNSLADDNIG